MSIKLIGLDIDGTLLNSRKQISPRTREAVDAAARAGIHIARLRVSDQIFDRVFLRLPRAAAAGASGHDPVHADGRRLLRARRVRGADR